MQNFRKLEVWQKAHCLTLDVYKITSKYPDNEKYGLTSQMRRCCASIPMNIVEGCGRGGGRDFLRFLHIAAGSAVELEYDIILSHDLGLLDNESFNDLDGRIQEIKRMLAGLQRSLMQAEQRSVEKRQCSQIQSPN